MRGRHAKLNCSKRMNFKNRVVALQEIRRDELQLFDCLQKVQPHLRAFTSHCDSLAKGGVATAPPASRSAVVSQIAAAPGGALRLNAQAPRRLGAHCNAHDRELSYFAVSSDIASSSGRS